MLLSERHARIRAHSEVDSVADAHSFVVDYFGGDWNRAVWFMDELRVMQEISGPKDTFCSVKTGWVRFYSRRDK